MSSIVIFGSSSARTYHENPDQQNITDLPTFSWVQLNKMKSMVIIGEFGRRGHVPLTSPPPFPARFYVN